MDTKYQINSQRTQHFVLSLKRDQQNVVEEQKKLNRSSDVILLEDSFDKLQSEFIKSKAGKNVCSPIVINDSSDFSLNEDLPNVIISNSSPSKKGNVSFNCSTKESIPAQNKKPSIGGWSPAQSIICATPKYEIIPSTPKDVANESQEKCSVKKIQLSQKKILNDIYGEAWQSIPKLFKSVKNGIINFDTVTKKLQFDDEENDRHNFRHDWERNKKLYLTGSEAKKKVDYDFNSEKKSKKKLYTEKIPNTPEPKQMCIRRDVNSTTKKQKLKKGLSVTQLVEIMKKDVDSLTKRDVDSVTKKDVECLMKKVENFAINSPVGNVNRLTFVGSLADNVPSWRCHVEALQYKDDYKNLRVQLSRRLYVEFNKGVFGDELDADMPILWDTKLRSTAGTTTNRLIKNSKGDKIRTSSIKLCTKVVDTPVRLRDTLVHEMCHAATWLIDGELRAGHGPLWKKWATRALKVYPELGEISRCHDMEIHYKYSYKCTRCGYSIHRHSKSIDVTKKCCGYCRGTFEIVVNKKNKDGVVVSTPARKRNMNEFAMFVKENYGSVKQGKTHAEVMKVLGEQFSVKKRHNVDIVL